MKKRKVLPFVIAFDMAASILISGCSTAEKPAANAEDPAGEVATSTGPKTITIGASQAGFDVSPFAGSSEIRFSTERMLWGMIAMGADENASTLDTFDLGIAKSLDIVDDTTVNVEIYDYIKDSKGNEIKASDVKFSYETMIETAVLPAVASSLESVEVTGDYTLTFRFADNAVGKKEYTFSKVPIISQAWYESASDEERSTDPATTGPYKVKSFETGSRLILEKVENYWQTDESLIPNQQQTVFDEINYVVIAEATQRSIALENGEIDSCNVTALDISRFMDADGKALDGWTVAYRSSVGGNYLFLNMAEGSTLQSNPKLREAICYAIDRESMRLGAGETATSSFCINNYGTPALNGYSEDIEFYDYDLEHAKQAFAESGCQNGLKLKALYSQGLLCSKGMPVIQANLAEIGIELELIGVDQALFNTYKNDPQQWDLILDYKGAGNGYVTYMFTSAFDNRGRQWGTNFTTDETLQELAIKASTEFSQENCDAFQNELKNQYQVIPLFTSYTYNVAQDGITEIVYSSDTQISPNCYKVASDYQSVVK